MSLVAIVHWHEATLRKKFRKLAKTDAMIEREEAEIEIEMAEEIGSGINQDPDREAVRGNVAEVEAKLEVVETGAGIAEALIGIDRRKERGPGQEKEEEG